MGGKIFCTTGQAPANFTMMMMMMMMVARYHLKQLVYFQNASVETL